MRRAVSAGLGNVPDMSDAVCELRDDIEGVDAILIVVKSPYNDHAE